MALKLLCLVQGVHQVVLLNCPLVAAVECGRFGAVEVLVVVAIGNLVPVICVLIIHSIVFLVRVGLVARVLVINILVVEFIVSWNFCKSK